MIFPAPPPQLPLEGLAPPPPRPRRPRLDWASLMRRTFDLDLLTCALCGGRRKVLAAVTQREAIDADSLHAASPRVPRPASRCVATGLRGPVYPGRASPMVTPLARAPSFRMGSATNLA